MKKVITIVLALTLLGCTEDDATGSTDLTGTWIDIKTLETLTFESIDGQPHMTLTRGKEQKGEFLLPKSGSGLYDYQLLPGDKIALRWMLSSDSRFNEYYFKQAGSQLMIERFFDTDSPGIILTFRKLD